MRHVIAAVSTGMQISAIGILRLSGDGCAEIAGQVFKPISGRPLQEAENRKLILGDLFDRQGRRIDRCMAVYSRAPHTYTGEDTVELQCHGSPAVLAAGLDALYQSGARPAQRGEFTKRAFLNGRMDLTQAEAVIDLIEADTADAAANAAGQVGGRLQAILSPIYDSLTDLCSHFHAVLDYPDEDIDDFRLEQYKDTLEHHKNTLGKLRSTYGQGSVMKNGVGAAILGKPNVGKSSLLNALAGYERAIVTDIAGTTRDTVEETVVVGHTRLRLTDTAGIHETNDRIEAMGVERSRRAGENADLILLVVDGSRPLSEEDRRVIGGCKGNVIALINKGDKPLCVAPEELPFETVLVISAETREGLEALAAEIDRRFAGSAPCDGSVLTNPRQYDAIGRAYDAMGRALEGLSLGLTPDALLTDVEEAMSAIGEVTGGTVREDITARIFERFCVGK